MSIIKYFKLFVSAFCIMFTVVTLFQNLNFKIENYKIMDSKLPENFDHFKIVQVSDLHSTFFDSNNKSVLKSIKEQNPDIIAITGDYVDKNTGDITALLEFSAELSKIADCYYITGNHEAQFCESYGYDKYLDKLRNAGFIILENDFVSLKRGNETINIAGLSDPLFREITDKKYTDPKKLYYDNYSKMGLDGYTILLVHRPYEFDTFLKMNVDIVLSGHEHGGQIRLPFIGGLFAPGEGLLPKYEKGAFKKGGTTMIVSSGLGNGEAPIRINNIPEITVIEIER